jgi:uncharacterized protein (TIGR03437 family)
MRYLTSLLTIAACNLPVWAQAPSIDRVVNAASYQEGLAPGAIGTIFGERLAPRARTADTAPLPRTLEGTTVLMNGSAVPLFYISPNQINFLVPDRSLTGFPVGPFREFVTVRNEFGGSTIEFSVDRQAPGIFTQAGTGCGPGLIQNIAPDGTPSLNTRQNSAEPGAFITLWGTGFGSAGQLPDDQPAPSSPLVRLLGPEARLAVPGHQQVGPYSLLSLTARAPGLIGVDQHNTRLPPDAPEGCSVPLYLTSGNVLLSAPRFRSQPVTIAIRRGGGACQDPPPARWGSIDWERRVLSGVDPGRLLVTETVEASFQEVASNLVPVRRRLAGSPGCGAMELFWPLPACEGTLGRAVSAGSLVVRTASAEFPLSPAWNQSDRVHRADLPAAPGLRPPESLTIIAQGDEIGAFQTTLNIPPPPEILNDLSPGAEVRFGGPVEFRWRNAPPGSTVRVSYTGRSSCDFTVSAEPGSVTIRHFVLIDGFPDSFVGRTDDGRITITFESANPPTLSAPGLTVPAEVRWRYVYEFRRLRFR